MRTTPIVKSNAETIANAVDILRGGGLVVGPTATNYNLFCDATNEEAISRVFRVKERTKLGPLPVSLPNPSDIGEYGKLPDGFNADMFDALLPGEISFIFRQAYPFPDVLTCGLRTVALSVTSDSVMRSLVLRVGPLAATSANISGQGNLFVSLDKAVEDLNGKVDLFLDAGPTQSEFSPDHPARVNTIVDMTFDPPYLARPGWVPLDAVARWIPNLNLETDKYLAALQERSRAGRG